LQDLNLRYLYEAAKLGSMRAAADQLGVAVSSVSRQISQLEAEVGMVLIEHGRRNVKLTEAGQLLIQYYAEQLTQREIFEGHLADLKGLRTGRIQLAIGEGFLGAPLSRLISKFIAKYRGLLVDVRVTASSNEVARLVVEDEAHLGLAFQASDDPRIRVLSSVRQPLCAIMRASHPLASQQSVTLAELAAHPMCLPEASFRTRQLLKVTEVTERVSLQPSVTANSLVLLKSLVSSGELITLLPLLAVSEELERKELVAIPINSTALRDTSVHLICRLGRHLTPAPLRLMNALMLYLDAYRSAGEQASDQLAEGSPPAPAPT
jgi:DNA-binding transcriptional LysR family regulator